MFNHWPIIKQQLINRSGGTRALVDGDFHRSPWDPFDWEELGGIAGGNPRTNLYEVHSREYRCSSIFQPAKFDSD